jgi:hypothetical protein
MLAESPRAVSGIHASSSSEAPGFVDSVDADESGRPFPAGFCCSSAMYPGILSFEDGEGWT